MTFNPNEHLMKLQTKDYLEVKWRLVWFRDLCPNGTIETEIVHLDLDREMSAEVYAWNDEKKRKEKVLRTAKGYCVCRATVRDGKGGIGTGTKSEAAVDFADFIEKSESGAIGRALATLGYGTQFTGDELEEHHRIVDSPVERKQPETESEKPAQSPELQEIITRCIARAKKSGVVKSRDDWEQLKRDANVEKPDGQLIITDVARINGLLTEREKAAKPAQEMSV